MSELGKGLGAVFREAGENKISPKKKEPVYVKFIYENKPLDALEMLAVISISLGLMCLGRVIF